MKNFEQVQVESRAALRAWLEANYTRRESVWLVTFKKGKGPHVGYDAIVEEVICFGWIDSRVAKLDDDCSQLLISPRRPGSAWSKVNKQRVTKLEALGLIAPAGQAMIDLAKSDGTWDALNDVDALIEPPDLIAALSKLEGARTNWDRMPPSSKRGILEWINAAKRDETRLTRVNKTAELAALGLKANFPEGRNKI